MPRILGLDYGERRIGLAISDEAGIIAMPVGRVQVRNRQQVLSEVQRIIREKQVGKAVIGMPLNMNGSKGPASEAVSRFVIQLREQAHIPVETWDERLSSQAAERVLIDADLRRKQRKGVIDQLAAQIVLQSYLDAQASRRASQN